VVWILKGAFIGSFFEQRGFAVILLPLAALIDF